MNLRFSSSLRRDLKRSRILRAGRDIQRVLRKHFIEAPAPDEQVVMLEPERSAGRRILLSYILDPFLLGSGQAVSSAHTHHWESQQMARTFLELGYGVDVISYRNQAFVPDKEYALFIDARRNLERLSPILNTDCIKVSHLDTAHLLFQSSAELGRLLALQHRKGVTLQPRRYESPNWGIEHADCATVLGNEFTISTYRYANKPIYRIPISTPMLYPWDEAKDFEACRKQFLWFGSGGLVHKGLDLVLEAFIEMPGFHLTVCGPIDRETDFTKAYYRELYETPNIKTIGWIDVTGTEFRSLCSRTLGLVYPSCSEGGGGSVINCMHAGLIPVISREASVDLSSECGIVLPTNSIAAIKVSVETLASQPADLLKRMARNSWEFVRATHTRERFASRFREIMVHLLSSDSVAPDWPSNPVYRNVYISRLGGNGN